MSGNLPPGVTAADIDRHFGEPGHEHEFLEPYRAEADETLMVYQRCTHSIPRGPSCEAQQITHYAPVRIEVIHDGKPIMEVDFPDGFDHAIWAEDVMMAAEQQVHDHGVVLQPDPVQFDPDQETIAIWVESDDCSVSGCESDHRIVYEREDQEFLP